MQAYESWKNTICSSIQDYHSYKYTWRAAIEEAVYKSKGT